MKWNRLLLGVFLVALIVYIVIILYPVIRPVLAHPSTSGGLTALLRAIFSATSSPFRLSGPTPYVVLGFGGAVWLVMQVDTRTHKLTTHGSAHPATRREARPFRRPARPLSHRYASSHTPRRREMRLLLGWQGWREISLNEEQQASNVFLTGPVGVGKSSRVFIPNLFREDDSGSLFVCDVKGELLPITGSKVAQQHEVWVVDFLHPDRSEGYNPLALIRGIEDAQEFARCWVANTGHSPEDYWNKVARHLLTWTILHLRVAEPQAPFSRVADILCGLPYERLKRLLTTTPATIIRQEATAWFDYLDRNPRLIGSAMTETATRFEALSGADMRVSTAHNQIDFRAMTERPIALYLEVPRRYAERYQPLVACFVQQMFATWEELAEASPNGRLARRILCYLDEFTNLGVIPNMSGYISTARHTGVGMLIAVQSFAQIDEKYGKNVRGSILTNCLTHLLLPGAGLEETEYYSRRIGNTTVKSESQHRSGGGLSAQDSWTQGETARRLWTPEELRTLASDEMLMLHASTAPMLLKTRPYYRDRKGKQWANLPFPHVRVSPEPPVLPSATGPHPPIIIDAEQNPSAPKPDNAQFFLDE